ncbi:MAG TPA: AAA family ATPase [Candidatus Binataceae bacterium]|nr:AAA family ATPase [Candidatus Binataceae bacterium]
MRFESIKAAAFGCLCDQTLELAPGFNLIYGLNEAGKSTWHAVLYVALCGRRRTKGPPSKAEREFERYRPWAGGGWAVSAAIVLEDGRRIEMRQDLEGGVDCRATDLDLGRDVSSEIVFEGAPDGSRWLGLNRRAFIATACVRQAQLLSLLANADQLQEHLQRAAASAGRDQTAARALELLNVFFSEQVGQDRVNSVRPLRQAINRLEQAQARLEEARRQRAEFDDLAGEAQKAETAAADCESRARAIEAAIAWRTAQEANCRLNRARELAARHPEAPVPVARELAHEVVATLAQWEQRPVLVPLAGPDSAQLRAQLEALPLAPSGDTVPHSEFVAAERDYLDVQGQLELHRKSRPAPLPSPQTGGASASELRDLAHELSLPPPEPAPDLDARGSDLGTKLRRARRASAIGIGGATIMLLLAAGAIAIRQLAWAALAGALCLIAAGWAYLKRIGLNDLDKELREVELARASAVHQHQQWQGQIEATRARLGELGLEPRAQVLIDLAEACDRAQMAATELERWQHIDGQLAAAQASAAQALAAALERRGVKALTADLAAASQTYRAACERNAAQAMQASRRDDLQRQLSMRLAAEAAYQQAQEARASAQARLHQAAQRCGLAPADDDDLLVGQLREWLAAQQKAVEAYQLAYQEWVELTDLLKGRALQEMAEEAAHCQQIAAQLSAQPPAQLASASNEDLTRARDAYNRARSDADLLRGQVSARLPQLPPLAEAEEEMAAAQSELERVRRLEDTLTRTREFLQRAQERAHRDIAPVLAASIGQSLADITGGRYREAIVDPANLMVQVRDRQGELREATRLSHGSAEQIFLLLHAALASHLTKTGEVCPMLLDDVTVHCDHQRVEAVMAVLHQLSRQRQVILFTQDMRAYNWAQTYRDPTRDRLIELPPPV